MSDATCEFPTGTAYSGPRVCGRAAKYVFRTTNKAHWFGDGRKVCGIHKRSVLRFSITESRCEPITEAKP